MKLTLTGAKLKDCGVPIKFVAILGKWNKDDDNSYHILITNKLNSPTKTVIANYLLRWGIEYCFKELKDTFYLDHYQVRHINKIDRYWNLVRLSSRQSPVLLHGLSPTGSNKMPILLKSLKRGLPPLTKSNRLSILHSNSPLQALQAPYQRTKNLPMAISKLKRNALRKNTLLNFLTK